MMKSVEDQMQLSFWKREQNGNSGYKENQVRDKKSDIPAEEIFHGANLE